MPSSRPGSRAIDTIPPEALLADFPPPHQALGQRLREIVTDAVPDAIERVRPGWRLIGYDLPAKRKGVFFAWIWPEPEHVHLGFPRGVDMDDPLREMRGDRITKLARWLTYSPGDAIDDEQATRLIREAARVALLPRFGR
jgi:hypothetical protein